MFFTVSKHPCSWRIKMGISKMPKKSMHHLLSRMICHPSIFHGAMLNTRRDGEYLLKSTVLTFPMFDWGKSISWGGKLIDFASNTFLRLPVSRLFHACIAMYMCYFAVSMILNLSLVTNIFTVPSHILLGNKHLRDTQNYKTTRVNNTFTLKSFSPGYSLIYTHVTMWQNH